MGQPCSSGVDEGDGTLFVCASGTDEGFCAPERLLIDDECSVADPVTGRPGHHRGVNLYDLHTSEDCILDYLEQHALDEEIAPWMEWDQLEDIEIKPISQESAEFAWAPTTAHLSRYAARQLRQDAARDNMVNWADFQEALSEQRSLWEVLLPRDKMQVEKDVLLVEGLRVDLANATAAAMAGRTAQATATLDSILAMAYESEDLKRVLSEDMLAAVAKAAAGGRLATAREELSQRCEDRAAQDMKPVSHLEMEELLRQCDIKEEKLRSMVTAALLYRRSDKCQLSLKRRSI
eukprot:TRINITY_DN121080_c0_g1_i1.p1 TRINITY_DN121080_c0_g1~~TRINITY_DN121080_c0_g1_i1.p1  ORF type:complete len:292 (-),score=69.90 TRINITY_DN121080_c0_g1_i1:66-941(-)